MPIKQLSKIIEKILDSQQYTDNELFSKKGKIYTFLNPVSYLIALDNKSLFEQFDGIFADGSFLVTAIKLLYGKKVTRKSFDMTSLAPRLFNYAEQNKKSIYIVASQQKQVEKAISIFKEKFPELIISGYRNGYFVSESEINEEAMHITKINPDFLIVGMGILIQEKFLLTAKSKGFKGIGFTCGGFIHQSSKDEIEYYPTWINKLNLRFIYRMYKEKHTRKRYIQAAFLFPIQFFRERFRR